MSRFHIFDCYVSHSHSFQTLVSEHVDGEGFGIHLDDVVDDDVGTQSRVFPKLLEGGQVLGREVVHNGHGSTRERKTQTPTPSTDARSPA